MWGVCITPGILLFCNFGKHVHNKPEEAVVGRAAEAGRGGCPGPAQPPFSTDSRAGDSLPV